MSADDLAGRAFAHYRVLERIGARARLLDEARKAGALNHPGICTIHEAGEAEGQAYIAMEWVRGRPLNEGVPARGLPVETSVAYAAQIADALAHAHERGIVHRDLKSANVLVTPEGRLKLLDFGIARRSGASAARGLTETGAVVGTPHCLPPEVLGGQPADARGDIWALGVLLHELLSGEPPFGGRTDFEIAAAILHAEPAALPAHVPPALRGVVQRCLAKDPAARFQHAHEVRAVLEMAPVVGPAVGTGPQVEPVGAGTATPRARRRWPVVAVLGGVAVVGLVVLAGVVLRGRGPRGATGLRSLAVLPLENLSGDPEQEFFADGLTEELIARLARLEGVRVISRTSVMRYKRTTKSIRQIARELDVDAVIEGSALRAGDRVRITAQLIHGARDEHLWANSYERDLRDVLALQGDVARAIAAEIGTRLGSAAASDSGPARRVDPRAYEEYLKGRFHWNKRNAVALRQALQHFQRALEIDPDYAQAWAGLADTYGVMSAYTGDPWGETAPLTRKAALRAIELDPHLAEPYAALTLVNVDWDYDWAAAEAGFQQALRLNPNLASARHWRGLMLLFQGKLDEALAEIDRALAVDPLPLIVRNSRARVLMAQRRYDEAMAEFRRVLELDPTFMVTHIWIATLHTERGNLPLAAAEYRLADSLAGRDLHGYDELQRAASNPSPRVFWRQDLAFLQDSTHRRGYPSQLALAHAQLGEADLALRRLEEAFRVRDGVVVDFLPSPLLDPVRSDPRFAALLRRCGLEP